MQVTVGGEESTGPWEVGPELPRWKRLTADPDNEEMEAVAKRVRGNHKLSKEKEER